MIILVGVDGITGWVLRTPRGEDRQLVCLNDGFSISIPIRAAKNPRQVLIALRDHSESLNGRTLSLADVPGLT